MRSRIGAFVLVGGVLLVSAGCGFDALPSNVDRGSGMRIGLDPTPENVSRGKGMDPLFDTLPKNVDRGRGMELGLDATPGGPEKVADLPAEGERRPVTVMAAKPNEATAATKSEPKLEPIPVPKPEPTLRMSFQAGTSRRYKQVITQKIRIPAMGEMADTDTRMEFEVTTKVMSATADQGTIQTTIDSFLFSMNSAMMGELSFDTRKPETLQGFRDHMLVQMQPALQGMPDIVGKSITVGMRFDGTVVPGSSVGTEALSGSLGAMGGSMNVEQMSAVLAAFPTAPVKVGLTWPIDSTAPAPQGGSLHTTGSMTVTAWEEVTGIATIATDATVAIDLKGMEMPGGEGMSAEEAAQAEAMLASIKVKSSSVKGQDTFDTKNGYRVSSQSSTEMVLEMPNPMMPDEGMEMNMTMNISQDLMP
jgi:hypothetical protein